MTVEELGYKCKEIDIDCDICQHKEKCEHLHEGLLEDISPYGLLSILKKELD